LASGESRLGFYPPVEPNSEHYETKKKPLGSLQELEGAIRIPSPY
jgi:hypothetical protein